MGHQLKLGFFIILSGIAVKSILSASAPSVPEYLPKPPPLPKELRDGPPTLPPELPDPSQLFSQLRQLETLISLSPMQLKELRQTIEFIEKMSPSEREAMRLRLTQIKQLSPELRSEIYSFKQFLPAVEHPQLTQFWMAATLTQKEAVRKALATMPDDKKRDFLQSEIAAFIQRRETVFSEIKATLNKKKETSEAP